MARIGDGGDLLKCSFCGKSQKQVKKLQESWKEVQEGDMPPWYYLPVHRNARLSVEDRAALHTWALSTAAAPEGKSDK